MKLGVARLRIAVSNYAGSQPGAGCAEARFREGNITFGRRERVSELLLGRGPPGSGIQGCRFHL